MAKKFAYLEYIFIFEPSATWDSLSSFESDFSAFLKFHGKEAEFLDTVANVPGKKILFIKSLDKLDQLREGNKK